MPGRALGSSERDALIAACTSRAATLMSLPRSNCTLMRVDPCELRDEISLTPAIVPSARSSGVATLEAIVSGLAPGSAAETWIVGKSTCGSGETGRSVAATAPVEDDRQAQQRGGDRTPDERRGQAHGRLTRWASPGSSAPWGARRRPRRSKNR